MRVPYAKEEGTESYAGYIGSKSGFSLLEVCVLININVSS